MNEIKSRIIEELAKGDCLYWELKKACAIKKDPELWAAIASLKSEGKIEHYYKPTPPSATLAYQLVAKEEQKLPPTKRPSAPIPPWGTKCLH